MGPTGVENAAAPRFVGGLLMDTPVRRGYDHLLRLVRSGAMCALRPDVANLCTEAG